MYSCMGKPGALPSSDTSLSLSLSLFERERNQGVCGHKRSHVVAEPLKGVYTRIKKGCPRLKTFSVSKQFVDFIYKPRGQLSQCCSLLLSCLKINMEMLLLC